MMLIKSEINTAYPWLKQIGKLEHRVMMVMTMTMTMITEVKAKGLPAPTPILKGLLLTPKGSRFPVICASLRDIKTLIIESKLLTPGQKMQENA